MKAIFIHGRPNAHPIHKKYADLLNADFIYEDELLQWLELADFFKIKRYTSWLINALFFKNKKKYNIFFCECLRVPPFIMKKLKLLKANQKLIALMADESLYFLEKNKRGFFFNFLMKQYLNTCDYVICVGDLQYKLAIKHINRKNIKNVKIIYNTLDISYLNALINMPIIINDVFKFVIIGNLNTNWRSWYKGVDICFLAFKKVLENKNNKIELHVLGDVPKNIRLLLIDSFSMEQINQVFFHGIVRDLTTVLNQFDLCLHVSRGDAFPTSNIECLVSGIPVIASLDTGTANLIRLIDEKLIVNIDIDETFSAINYFLNLPKEEKIKLKEKCKMISYNFNIKHKNSFLNVINEIL